MLHHLAGKEHQVYTGLTMLHSGHDRMITRVAKTSVFMRSLSQGEIDAYIASGEPLGKAGAYAIQGIGATLVERIDGCYYNVVGLPVVTLISMMQEIGFPGGNMTT